MTIIFTWPSSFASIAIISLPIRLSFSERVSIRWSIWDLTNIRPLCRASLPRSRSPICGAVVRAISEDKLVQASRTSGNWSAAVCRTIGCPEQLQWFEWIRACQGFETLWPWAVFRATLHRLLQQPATRMDLRILKHRSQFTQQHLFLAVGVRS